MKKLTGIFFAVMVLIPAAQAQFSIRARDSINKITSVDYQNMLQQLGIKSIRQGANGNDPKAPNAANYDEAKANPYPNLPDPLVMKSGKTVTSAGDLCWPGLGVRAGRSIISKRTRLLMLKKLVLKDIPGMGKRQW